MAMNNTIIIYVISCISVASKAVCNDTKTLNLLTSDVKISKYLYKISTFCKTVKKSSVR